MLEYMYIYMKNKANLTLFNLFCAKPSKNKQKLLSSGKTLTFRKEGCFLQERPRPSQPLLIFFAEEDYKFRHHLSLFITVDKCFVHSALINTVKVSKNFIKDESDIFL